MANYLGGILLLLHCKYSWVGIKNNSYDNLSYGVEISLFPQEFSIILMIFSSNNI